MITLIILFGIIAAIAILSALVAPGRNGRTRRSVAYRYTRRNFFLTRAEHECYDALVAAVGESYYIFAQVHLPTLVDHKVKGQGWRGAFSHINGKSVDFVLCDKAYISPKLAIELDDRSHDLPEREERDREVERILREAGVPLLRLENHGRFDAGQLAWQITEALGPRSSVNTFGSAKKDARLDVTSEFS
jgi:very-short-patch-repair endonuclease